MRFQKNSLPGKIIFSAMLGAVISGCALTSEKSFLLRAKMPAEFKLKADAYYVSATGAACKPPPRKQDYVPDRRRFISERPEVSHTVEFKIPLSIVEGGCPLVLKSLKLDIDGRWGPELHDRDGDYASISFRDSNQIGKAEMESSNSNFRDGECQWLFRTLGAKQHIVKILRCRAIDEDGQIMDRPAGGSVERNQLAGKKLNISFKLSDKEEPYMSGTWISFPEGWRRCMGSGLTDQYAFCLGNNKDFKPFIMPDGKLCNVYPGCSE